MKKNVNFTPGILSGYQNYEGLAGLSKKVGCGVYIKDIIYTIITRQDQSIKSKKTRNSYNISVTH